MTSRRGSTARPGRWMSNLAESPRTPRGSPPATSGTIATNATVAVAANVPIPVGAKVYDAAGKHLVPGLVENHSHIGAKSNDLNDSPMVIGPQLRFIDALDLDDPDWKDAVEGGVTTIVTGPGSGE